MFPIRCFSCNKVVARYESKYIEKIKSGKTPNEALNELSINRYCCRRMFLGYVNLIDNFIQHSQK